MLNKTNKKYKIVARQGKDFFVHKSFDTREEAEAVLEDYENDPDITNRDWKFWIHKEE